MFARTLFAALLLAGLVGAPAIAAEAPLAVDLRDAISSGEWKRVRPFFHAADDPVMAYMAARWEDMRKGRLDPVAWEVSFDPYDDRPGRQRGQLSIAARLADGSRVGRRFDVKLVQRGSRLLVGEAIAYDNQDARLDRHDMAIDLTGPRLSVTDEVRLVPTGPDRGVYMHLLPSLQVESVSAGGQPLPFRQVREVLYFERPAGPGAQAVSIRYAGTLPEGDWDFVRPEGTVLRSDTAWYPRLPFDNPFAVFRARITVPAGHKAIAVGDRDGIDRFEHAWVYQWTTSRAVEGLTVYAGPYQHYEGMAGDVRMEAYVPPGREEAVPRVLGEAADVLAFYGRHFGNYPYRKLALVETAFPGGYGATTAVALPGRAFVDDGLREEFLAHEIAHNWTDLVAYGGSLGERGFMAEGLASYMDLLYRAERGGAGRYREGLQAAQRRYRKLVGTALDVPIARAHEGASRLAWQTLTYDKGALIFHMLKGHIGDEAFLAGVRGLYTEHAGKTITLADMRASFERESRKSLGLFFDQWLERPGLPEIAPLGLSVEPIGEGRFRVSGTLAQGGRPYYMNVPLVVVSDAGKTLYHVPVHRSETDFQLLVTGQPRFLLLDPLGDALLTAAEPIAL